MMYKSFLGGDPNTNEKTDPSHSQLAKDHDTHHFHTLAVLLAKCAVMTVGQAIQKRWDGDSAVDPAEIAASFLKHPSLTNWQHGFIEKWVSVNKAHVERGESPTEIADFQRRNKKEIERVRKGAEETFDYWKKFKDEIVGGKKPVKK